MKIESIPPTKKLFLGKEWYRKSRIYKFNNKIMNTKLRCTVCGAILLTVGATEVSNLIYGYCSHCNHLHTIERNFPNDMPKIDSMTSAISASVSPSAAITDNDFE